MLNGHRTFIYDPSYHHSHPQELTSSVLSLFFVGDAKYGCHEFLELYLGRLSVSR